MKREGQINPEFRQIAKNIPYNQLVIRLANLFQAITYHFAGIPRAVVHRSISIKGYRQQKVKVDIFEPSNSKGKLPCLIDVHGGAFSYRASAHHKKLACMYAMQAGCRVYFPHYHLTPKYPYPAAYEDVLALYRCIVENSEEFGIDDAKIGMAGDSAGASIAALICNRHEREGIQRPCAQMLIYPLTDGNMQTDSMKKFSDTPIWNSKSNRRMWLYYCRAEDVLDASPMHSVLPPSIPDTYIETAELDCLHDEGILYGEKLRKAGANVEINETSGTIHGYDSALNVPTTIRNIERRILFLKNGFADRLEV